MPGKKVQGKSEVVVASGILSEEAPRVGRVDAPISAELLASTVVSHLREMSDALECERLLTLSYAPRDCVFRVNASVGFSAQESASLLDTALPEETFPDWLDTPGDPVPRFVSASDLPFPLCPPLSGEVVLLSVFLPNYPIGILAGQLRPDADPASVVWGEKARQVAPRAALLAELVRTGVAYQNELRMRYTTRDLTASLLEGAPIEEVGESITAIVAQLLHEERAALYLNDETGKTEPIYLRNLSQEYGHGTAKLAPHSPIVAQALSLGQPYHARGVQTNPEMPVQKRELFQKEGIVSLLIAPLQFAERVYGTLVVYPSEDREFSATELTIFQSFADMATLGVALSRQLEQQKQLATTEERNRLAREMHDTVAQALTGLAIQLETAQSLLKGGNSSLAEEMLTGARESAQKALEDTRRAVQGLSPASLERLTPAEALEREAERFEKEQGVLAQFLLHGEERTLTQETQTALFRVAQEALNNAGKHAGANRVRIGLQYLASEVTLRIEDDGCGFEVEARPAPGPEGGYGLFGMMERARLLGGEVRIESTPGWGTRVLARLPYLSPQARPVPESQVVVPLSTFVPIVPQPGKVPLPIDFTPPLPFSRKEAAAEGVKLRVLIADDHQVTRQGVKLLLEATGEIVVVAEANDGVEALMLVERHSPDVALFDLNMPHLDGIETLRRLRETRPELPVVIFTSFPTDETVRDALRAGAKGYLKKDAASSEIVAAIRAAFQGETMLGQDAALRLAAIADRGREDPLSERALEVLQLLAQGARNKEIAAKLFISERTVEYHLSTLFSRLNVSNRTEAVKVGLDRGLIGK